MQVTNVICPTEKIAIKCPYDMNTEFIIVHNTANDASAMSEVSYMLGNGNYVSFHYAIDDYRIVRGIDENRNTWNAGDGANGRGNRKGISIEICYSKSGGDRFTKAELLAAEFIAYKLKEKGWGIERVTKHQDFNGKYCPHRSLDLGWERFLNLIVSFMYKELSEEDKIKMENILKRLDQIEQDIRTLKNNSVAAPVQPNVQKYTVTAVGVNVRKSPSLLAARIKYYNIDRDIFEILEDNGTWVRSADGWIKKSFIRAV